MNFDNIRIAVTGMNATENPGPGVAVIRAIKAAEEFKGEIIGFTYDPLDPGVFMDNICDHVYLIPYPSEGAYTLLKRLEDIQKKTPIDVIIPTLDAELATFISIKEDLNNIGISLYLPTMECFELRSKAHFNKLKERFGISVPKGRTISDPSEFRKIEDEFNFPVMIKGQFYDAYIAYSPMEAESYFRKISSSWGLPVIIQEFIMGSEYDVVALGDGEGNLVGAVPMKKMQLTEKGKAWGGITIEDSVMNEFIKEVIHKLSWKGPCELEIMKSQDTGEYYLIEINPRFPAWCFLAVGAGQNLQWATVKLALDIPVTPFESYKVGTMFLRNSIDHIYSFSDYQEITTIGEIHR